MAYRKRMGNRKSRKLFTRTAKRVHRKNVHRVLSRGGIRL